MKCDDCLLLLEEYFDGELTEPIDLRIKEHLTGCPSCSGVLQSLAAEQAVYAAYESPLETVPGSWTSIQARIAEPTPAPTSTLERLQLWFSSTFPLPSVSGSVAAALVILSVGITVLVMKYMSRPVAVGPQISVHERPGTATAPPLEAKAIEPRQRVQTTLESAQLQNSGTKANVTSAGEPRKSRGPSQARDTMSNAKTPDRLVREAEQKYLAAIAMLSRNVERRRSYLDAATLARLDHALASIDRTIADTRKAVRRHPDDPLAAQYMLTAYAKKIDVLREMVDH